MSHTTNLKYVLYARKSTDEKNKQQLSIESQIEEMEKLAQREGLSVVQILVEKMSAKKPGTRKAFYEMLDSIGKGKANCILTWKLDRLSRNASDSGRIQQMMDEQQLLEVKCYDKTYHAEDNVLLTYLEFGMSHEYRQRLSVDVKRGCRTKIQQGWIPGNVPTGYVNKRIGGASTVEIDPERFEIVRKSWSRLLEGRYSLRRIHQMAIEDGLRGRKGTPYCKSNFYKLFTNPFYYGYFKFSMEPGLHKGSHQPMITKEQFDQAQLILSDDSKPCVKTNQMPFTNMVKCSGCGSSITGYEKVKRQKNGKVHRYTYYCCTRTKDPKCTQKQIRGEDLELQLGSIVDTLTLPAVFHKWALVALQREYQKETGYQKALVDSRKKALVEARKMVNNYISMRARGELDEKEYTERKKALVDEIMALEGKIAKSETIDVDITARIDSFLKVLVGAKKAFEKGDRDARRQLLYNLGLNLSLTSKTLCVTMVPPFRAIKNIAPLVKELCGRIEPGLPDECQRVMDDTIPGFPEWWAIQDLNL